MVNPKIARDATALTLLLPSGLILRLIDSQLSRRRTAN
jgi:hypothetical protein